MDLKNEKITLEEIVEFEELETMTRAEQTNFHEDVLEWISMEQVLNNFHDILFVEVEREEAYAYKKSIAYEYLLER